MHSPPDYGKMLRSFAKRASRASRALSPFSRLRYRGVAAFEISRDVQRAIDNRQAIVALESTIVTHGMPYPRNVATALDVEALVRSRGALPATIGVIDGKLRVGLTREEIECMGRNAQSSQKISRRDFPIVLGEKLTGGTTVSATAFAARKAGIEVFVTGGIGGVHRGAEASFDVSADLTELGRTPVAVVCAGVKSILDVGLTLEYLETQGVCVVTFGETDDFPAFFTRDSGFKSNWNVTTATDCAKLIREGFDLNTGSGIVVAVPIPEENAADSRIIENSIQEGIAEAERLNIKGRHLTPFLLKYINEKTDGASLRANVALVKNNAIVGADIAVELAKLKQETTTQEQDDRSPVIIGASIVDFVAKVDGGAELRQDGSTNPGRISQSFGGVGRNVAECVARLGERPHFISAVGNDPTGELLRRHWKEQVPGCGNHDAGMSILEDRSTATYCVVLRGDGEVQLAVGDMAINDVIDPRRDRDRLIRARLVCIDGNLNVDAMKFVCATRRGHVWFEPACVEKAKRPILAGVHRRLTHMTPNYAELVSFCDALGIRVEDGGDPVVGTVRLCEKLLDCVPCVVTTLGERGVVVARDWRRLPGRDVGRCGRIVDGKSYAHFAPARGNLMPVHVTSVNGAGDSLTGGMIVGTLKGYSMSNCVRAGLRAAYASLLSKNTVSDQLDISDFTEEELEKWGPDFEDVSSFLRGEN